MSARVAWLAIAPVKALALVHLDEVELTPDGIPQNRRFFLVDERGRLFNAKELGALATIRADADAKAERLRLDFPDGDVVEGAVELGEETTTSFYGRPVAGRVVLGGFSEALTEFAGKPLRVVRAERPGAGVDRGRGAVSLLSRASLERLAEAAGTDAPIDERRFRMTIGIEGVAAHEEDGWIGRRVRVGDAVVVARGNVGRCVVTTQNPETGVPDLRTLHALRSYRPDGTERLPFGVYGDVAEPGRVRLGDPVEPA